MINCSICFEDTNNYKQLDCKHKFCTECIYDWATVCSNTCPLCRAVINGIIKVSEKFIAFPTKPEVGMTVFADKLELWIEECIYEEYIWCIILSVDGISDIQDIHDLQRIVKSCNSRLCEFEFKMCAKRNNIIIKI